MRACWPPIPPRVQNAKQSQPNSQRPDSPSTGRCQLLFSFVGPAEWEHAAEWEAPSDCFEAFAYPPYSLTGDQSGLTGSAGGASFENSAVAYTTFPPTMVSTDSSCLISSSGMEK